jgi:hypothetical protein
LRPNLSHDLIACGSPLLSGPFFTIRFSSACDRDAVTGPVATSCTESDGLGGGWVTTRGAGSKTLAFQSINNFRLTISVKRQLFVVHFRQLFVVPHTQLGGAAVFAVILGSFTLAALLIHMTFKFSWFLTLCRRALTSATLCILYAPMPVASHFRLVVH